MIKFTHNSCTAVNADCGVLKTTVVYKEDTIVITTALMLTVN